MRHPAGGSRERLPRGSICHEAPALCAHLKPYLFTFSVFRSLFVKRTTTVIHVELVPEDALRRLRLGRFGLWQLRLCPDLGMTSERRAAIKRLLLAITVQPLWKP